MPSEPLDPLPKKLDGYSEETTLEFKKCDHKKATIRNGELRCPCGAAWTGSQIQEMARILAS